MLRPCMTARAKSAFTSGVSPVDSAMVMVPKTHGVVKGSPWAC